MEKNTTKTKVVRVKGLEPPRQRRQNLNRTNINSFQTVAAFVSQDKAKTNHESGKSHFDLHTNENPGATAIATGAKDVVEGVCCEEVDIIPGPIIQAHWGIAA